MFMELMAILVVPLLLGSSLGSLYFVASSHARYDKWWVLISMVVTSWGIGYFAGLPFADSPASAILSLICSALGVVILDATASATIRGEETPPILKWILDVISSVRGGKQVSKYDRDGSRRYRDDDDHYGY